MENKDYKKIELLSQIIALYDLKSYIIANKPELMVEPLETLIDTRISIIKKEIQ